MSKMILIDDEGENQAVRMFLTLYGGACGVTSEQMRKHLTMAGFDGAWPEWANSNNGHLTKAGAQLWIRHLFALEQPAQQESLKDLWHKVWPDAGTFVRVSADDLTQFAKAVSTPPQPAQRKPLTDEEIERIYDRYGGNMMNCARAIERAHGIKGGK